MPVAALALIAVLGLLWFLWTARRSPEPTRPMTVVPLTSFEGFKNFGSFSPDGRSIVFSWNGGHGGFGGLLQRNIYIMKTGGSAPVRLTFAQQDAGHPAWSPDGRYIAFCRMIERRGPFGRFGIYVVPAAGGTERKITEGAKGVSWSPDGKVLAVAGLPPESGGILLVSVKTGKRTRVTGPRPYRDELPIFSPDGRWIAFNRLFGSAASELFVVPSHGGTARQLTFDPQPTYEGNWAGGAWTADSKEIVFSSNRGGGGDTLWRIAAAGGLPQKVSATLWGVYYPAVSRQGNRLLFTESYQDTNIYSSSGAGFRGRFAPARFSAPKPLIASTRRDDSPSVSPTDGRIAFVSVRTGKYPIRRKGDFKGCRYFVAGEWAVYYKVLRDGIWIRGLYPARAKPL